MFDMAEVLIDVDGLTDAMLSDRPPVILDVRWQLGRDDGADRYREGHIPGAVYVDLDRELAAPASPEQGRHPLPDLADLQAAARRWGIDPLTPVVAYDDNGNLAAARAWWLLRWGGLTDVRLLDGGLAAWRAAGLRISAGAATPRVGSVTLTAGGMPLVDIDEVAAYADAGALIDARAAERYRGDAEPIDPRAGHIPGARSVPTGGNLDPDGRFLPAADLRARFSAAGLDAAGPDAAGSLAAGSPVGVAAYCGSGVTAAHEVAALEIAGLSGVLFPGSWSAWSADPARPIATGDQP